MKKLLVVVVALAFIAGAAYAADQAKKVLEPVTTVVTSTGATVVNAADGTVKVLDPNGNPVVTAVNTTGKAAEDSVKTVTLQKVTTKTTSK